MRWILVFTVFLTGCASAKPEIVVSFSKNWTLETENDASSKIEIRIKPD